MSEFTIYHNPRCSKSRASLELLNKNNIEPDIIEYLENPPTEKEFRELLSKLGISAVDLVRSKEDVFKELKLANASEDELITAVCANPSIMERPVIVKGDRACIGRPPENILALL